MTPTQIDEGDGDRWVVANVGSDFPMYVCPKDFTSSGSLFCEGFGSFLMNKANLRFQIYYQVGYVSDQKEGPDTPYIGIGKCSPL